MTTREHLKLSRPKNDSKTLSEMVLETPRVRISTPTEPILPGRGFYQLEEDSLHVQIGHFSKHRRFFSYLESENVRFDLDREGRLIFIEVAVARRQWIVDPLITPPEVVEAADIRWLDFRAAVNEPSLLCSSDRTLLLLKYASKTKLQNYHLADTVIAQVDESNRLAAMWITDIIDDLAGQEIAAFRKKIRGERVSFT